MDSVSEINCMRYGLEECSIAVSEVVEEVVLSNWFLGDSFDIMPGTYFFVKYQRRLLREGQVCRHSLSS